MRTRAQRLDNAARSAPASVVDIVRAVAGVQAQDERAAALGVRVRGRDLTAGDIDHARADAKTITRTWCMRGTLHVVPADMLPALLAVFGPVYVARGRRRLAQFGLDDDASERGVEIIADTLAERGPLTRPEIVAELRRRRVASDPGGRAAWHLLRRTCLLGVVCEAGLREGQPAYARREDWMPDRATAPDRTTALGEVARWYIAAHQPASADDFAAWSGLPVADVRRGWEQVTDLVAFDETGRMCLRADTADVDPASPDTPVVRLLPAFDGYLLGHRRRDHAVAPEHAAQVHPGGGVIHPTLLVDGRVAGTWNTRSPARLAVTTFAGLGSAPIAALDAEVKDVARFLGHDLTLTVVGRTPRSVGGVGCDHAGRLTPHT
jgi:hypothetical protein